MAEKAGVAQHYLIICELCEQMPSVYFLRKNSINLSTFFRKRQAYLSIVHKVHKVHTFLSLRHVCAYSII